MPIKGTELQVVLHAHAREKLALFWDSVMPAHARFSSIFSR